MAVANDRYKFLTSLLKRLHSGRFNSETAVRRFQSGRFRIETATWIQKRFKNPLKLLESPTYKKISRRKRRAWLQKHV
jgi:hypothetical protein